MAMTDFPEYHILMELFLIHKQDIVQEILVSENILNIREIRLNSLILCKNCFLLSSVRNRQL